MGGGDGGQTGALTREAMAGNTAAVLVVQLLSLRLGFVLGLHSS